MSSSSSSPGALDDNLRRDKPLSTLQAAKVLYQTSPRELWLVFAIKFLESFAYFSLSVNMVLFVSNEHNLSDQEAGWLYGFYGVLTSVYGLLCGGLIDFLGVRKSLIIGGLVSATGRLLFAIGTSRALLYFTTLLLMPLGMAFGLPVLIIGIKRYTTERYRTYGFGLFYVMMNVAALLAGPATDICRFAVPSKGLDVLGIKISPIRFVLLLSATATFIMVGVAVSMREVAVRHNGQTEAFHPKTRTVYQMVTETCASKRFRQLMVLSALLTGVKSVFRHLDGTFPKYFIRELADEKAPYGLIYAINPAIIIVMVPVISARFKEIPHYDMILGGSWLTGASPFILCVMGGSILSASIWNIVLSFGEAFYSPRTYDFQMALAPEGEEGIYSALAGAPMYVAKLMTGGLSGFLLENYCPDTSSAAVSGGSNHTHHPSGKRKGSGASQCNSFLLWGVIGITTVSSPALLCCLRGFIDSPDAEGGDPPRGRGRGFIKGIGGGSLNDEASEALVRSSADDDRSVQTEEGECVFEMIETNTGKRERIGVE